MSCPQAAGFDLVEAKADHRNELLWLKSLLTGAKDAFEIDEPEFGKRRILAALRFIDESKINVHL